MLLRIVSPIALLKIVWFTAVSKVNTNTNMTATPTIIGTYSPFFLWKYIAKRTGKPNAITHETIMHAMVKFGTVKFIDYPPLSSQSGHMLYRFHR